MLFVMNDFAILTSFKDDGLSQFIIIPNPRECITFNMFVTEVNNLDIEQILQSVDAFALMFFSTLDKPTAPDQKYFLILNYNSR